jgi:hypothetical protein
VGTEPVGPVPDVTGLAWYLKPARFHSKSDLNIFNLNKPAGFTGERSGFFFAATGPPWFC